LRHRQVSLHHRDCLDCDIPKGRHIATGRITLHQGDALLMGLYLILLERLVEAVAGPRGA
jgi:hypothetical protein